LRRKYARASATIKAISTSSPRFPVVTATAVAYAPDPREPLPTTMTGIRPILCNPLVHEPGIVGFLEEGHQEVRRKVRQERPRTLGEELPRPWRVLVSEKTRLESGPHRPAPRAGDRRSGPPLLAEAEGPGDNSRLGPGGSTCERSQPFRWPKLGRARP